MADTTLTLDSGILQRNLDALSESFPTVADQLRAAQAGLPEATPARTRDGGCNLRLTETDGRATWFARTSIPRVRATALIERFDAGNANVMLPGIGEGSEAELLLARLGPHRAVFVWEENPAQLLLTFRLHDFAAAIATKRLVPVVAPLPYLASALTEILAGLPGHTCPDRLLIWPWQSPTSIGPCRSAIESAGLQTETQRRVRLSDTQKRLASLQPAPSKDGPAEIALFSIHAQEEVWTWVDAMAGAMADTGCRSALASIRTPGDVHPLARATRLATALERRPEMALLVEACRAEVADMLPQSTPAISWLSHNTTFDEKLAKRLGPRDRVAVTDSILGDRVGRLGIERSRICVVPRPALVTADAVPGWADRPMDVVIVAHLGSLDPRAYGFDLPTHITVWQAAVESMRKSLDTFTDHRMPEILDRAERQTRVRIGEPAVRADMIEALAGPVASSLIWQELKQALVHAGVVVSCHGYGWKEGTASPIPGLAGRFEIYRQAKCAVFASPTGMVSSDVLLAASAGAAVAWRAHPRDKQPGGFASLLDPRTQAVVFDRNQTAPAPVARLLGNPEQWQRLVTAARERCRSEHSALAALARLRAVATSFPAESPA